jgi:hypothetical protein
MTNFPVRVRYIDKDEVQVVKSSEEIQKGRVFTVEAINPQWGRKPRPVTFEIGGEIYE